MTQVHKAPPKPRLQVSFTREQYEVVKTLARLQKRPASQVISDLLDHFTPVLKRIAVVLQLAEKAQQEPMENLARAAEKAQAVAESHFAAMLRQLDMFEDALRNGAPGATPSGVVPGAGGGAEPPRTNRGVGKRREGGKRRRR